MSRAIRLSWTYRDTACIASVLICVIYAVLYIALNALDMLGCITFTFILKFFVLHFWFPLFAFSMPHSAKLVLTR